MTMQIYRTINGLGGVQTGALLYTRGPWVSIDTTYCLRIVNICEKEVINYSIAWASGQATLTVTDSTGDTTGSATTVATDSIVRVVSGAFWVDIERVAAGFDGVLQFRPTIIQNNEIAHDDPTDPSSLVTYRCVYIYAPEAMTIDSIAGIGVEVGVDTLGATAETIADEETAPTGITFDPTWSTGQAMLAGEWLPVWIEREANINVGEHINTVTITYTIGATQYTQVLTGAYVTYSTAETPYLLYSYIFIPSVTTQVYTVDSCTDPPSPIASLPQELDVGAAMDALHALGVDDFAFSIALRAATDGGAESQNQLFDYTLQLNYTTGDVTKPNAPTIDTFEFLTGGQVRLIVDHDQTDNVTRATRLYATCGAETLRVTLPSDQDVTVSEFIFAAETTWGSAVTVSVYAQDIEERQSTAATDTQYALWDYSNDKIGSIFTGARTSATPNYSDVDTDTFDDFVATVTAGYSSMSVSGTTIIEARSSPAEGVRIIGLDLVGGDVSGVGSADPVEVISATEFYLCAGSTRVAKIDTSAGTLTCDQYRAGAAPQGCPVAATYAEHDGVVYWQIYDPNSGSFQTWLVVDSNNNEIVFCYDLTTN